MRFEEVMNTIKNINVIENVSDGKSDASEYSIVDDIYSFKHLIAMPISIVSSQIEASSVKTKLEDLDDIEIIDDGNQILGWLYLCKNKEVGDIGLLSNQKFVAFLLDSDTDAFQDLNPLYTMKSNYLVLEESNYTSYLKHYMDASSLWGGFVHQVNSYPIIGHKTPMKQIVAVRDLNFPTPEHKSRSIRAVDQLYTFERFLNQYHSLEMLFDWQLVKNIRKEPSEIEAIERFKEYTGKGFGTELDRLGVVIKSDCKDISKFAKQLNTIKPASGDRYFLDRAKLLFFNDKVRNDEKNPLKPMIYDDFENNLAGKLEPTSSYFKNKSFSFDEKIIRITAYWIYQIRNAIVHRKFGEYFITDTDERFVVEYIEPLLKEVLCQLFQT